MPEAFTDIKVTHIKRKNILMLLKEAVNNALKHSNATTTSATAVFIENRLKIKMKGNGTGFDTKKSILGNKLKNYCYRSRVLNGTLNINSDERGSKVYFDIPLSY